MKPEEKSTELVYKYYDLLKPNTDLENCKQCALIAVDEIIEATKKYVAIRERVTYSKTGFDNVVHTQYDSFWQEVKQEIEKL